MPSGDVLLGYLHPHDIAASFHKSLLNLVGWDMAHDRRLSGWASIKCASGGIPEGRNQLANNFMSSECDWLFMVDADMGFESHALDQLLQIADPKDRPIVGGLAFAQREAVEDNSGGYRCIPRPTIFDWVEHTDGHQRFTGRSHYPTNSLVRCAATGGAFLLIHRTVIEQIHQEYGPTWFDRVRGSDGSLIGEDISFFARCQALEIPCHVHTGIRSTHMKHLWLGEIDFWHSFLAPPATECFNIYFTDNGQPDIPFWNTLRSTTGWYNNVHPDIKTALDDNSAKWLLITATNVRFRSSWYDHAIDTAKRYGCKVVGMNDTTTVSSMRGETARSVLVNREWLADQKWHGVESLVELAKSQNTFLVSLASEIEQPA
jgi:hypothetical protein